MNPRRLLYQAALLIRRDGFKAGVCATDANGNSTSPDPDAKQLRCVSGAARAIGFRGIDGDGSHDEKDYLAAMDMFCAHVGTDRVEQWADSSPRTTEEVVDAMMTCCKENELLDEVLRLRRVLDDIEEYDIDWSVGTGENVAKIQSMAAAALNRPIPVIPVPSPSEPPAGSTAPQCTCDNEEGSTKCRVHPRPRVPAGSTQGVPEAACPTCNGLKIVSSHWPSGYPHATPCPECQPGAPCKCGLKVCPSAEAIEHWRKSRATPNQGPAVTGVPEGKPAGEQETSATWAVCPRCKDRVTTKLRDERIVFVAHAAKGTSPRSHCRESGQMPPQKET